jgi:general secretion pathway protein L
VRALPRPVALASLDYRERTLGVKVKPESADPGVVGTVKAALAARGLGLTEAAPASWQVSNTGAKP